MDIKFSAKELKAKNLSVNGITFAYMMAIHNSEPEIWSQFKALIRYVEGFEGYDAISGLPRIARRTF